MSRDPLRTMLQIRKRTLDEAEASVGKAYDSERAACLRVDQATDSLDHEMKSAMNLAGGDDIVETFARWLPVGRRLLKQAHEAQRSAMAELDRARAVLTLARSGVRAVEKLIEDRNEAERLQSERRGQLILDEAGLRQQAEGSLSAN